MDISQKRRKPLAMSIMLRVAALFFIAMILVVIAASILSYIMAYRDANIIVKDKVSYFSQTLDDWMEVRTNQLYTTRDLIDSLPDEERTYDNIFEILEKSTIYGQEFGVIADYIVFESDGAIISGDGWIPDDDYDAREEIYYTTPMQTKDIYIQEPDLDVDTNGFVVTISLPFTFNGKIAGVLCRDLVIDAVQEIFEAYEQDDNSNIFLFTANGNIINHQSAEYKPSISKVTHISEVTNSDPFYKTKEDKTTMVRDYDGKSVISQIKKSAITGWTVGLSYPTRNLINPVIMTIVVIFATYILVTIITNLLVANLIRRKISPINELMKSAKRLEQGDFSMDIVPQNNDEIGDVIVAVNSTGKYLRSMINEINRVLRLMAVGDLTVKSDADFRGDFLEVKESIDTIISGIRRLLSEISELVETVTNSSMQVANHSSALSASVNEQSSQIDDIQARIESISDVIRQNVDECNIASQNTLDVSTKLQLSNEHMSHMVKAMSDITETSDQIKKISKTIEDMAMQTNILSINAAVEASHAGQHGKGFAVVADEVNSFANQCSEAAQSTTNLVDGSINAVNRGSTLANETAESLKAVVELAKTVATEIEKIVTLSARQEEEIKAISSSVSVIAKSITDDIANAEEGAATSQELSAQAQIMQETLKKFKM